MKSRIFLQPFYLIELFENSWKFGAATKQQKKEETTVYLIIKNIVYGIFLLF